MITCSAWGVLMLPASNFVCESSSSYMVKPHPRADIFPGFRFDEPPHCPLGLEGNRQTAWGYLREDFVEGGVLIDQTPTDGLNGLKREPLSWRTTSMLQTASLANERELNALETDRRPRGVLWPRQKDMIERPEEEELEMTREG